jgi:hypothetical protein
MRDMRRLLRLLAAIVTLVAVSGPAVPISAPVGKVVSAAATVRASGNTGARVLDKNDGIFFLDRISTNATGAGEFEFTDGTKLAVGPGASLVVDQFVFKSNSSFQKLGLSAAKGTFRWISGRSPSSAYKIRTPLGTMGIRGTAFDVTIRNGRVYIALINGNAKFCAGSSCKTLKRSCDYIVADGRKISEPTHISRAFEKRETAAQIFPYLADPRKLSSRYRVGGGNCLGKVAVINKTDKIQPATKVTASESSPEPEPATPTGHCGGGNCGNGKGKGGGNGNNDEGGGNDP